MASKWTRFGPLGLQKEPRVIITEGEKQRTLQEITPNLPCQVSFVESRNNFKYLVNIARPVRSCSPNVEFFEFTPTQDTQDSRALVPCEGICPSWFMPSDGIHYWIFTEAT